MTDCLNVVAKASDNANLVYDLFGYDEVFWSRISSQASDKSQELRKIPISGLVVFLFDLQNTGGECK